MRGNNYWFDASDAITKEASTLEAIYCKSHPGVAHMPNVLETLDCGIWGLRKVGDLASLVPNDLAEYFDFYDEIENVEEHSTRAEAAIASEWVKRMLNLLQGSETLSPTLESIKPDIDAVINEIDSAANTLVVIMSD